MDKSKFWELIESAHEGSSGMEEKCEKIKSSIRLLSKEEAIEFSNFFDEMMDRAYSWPLWGAAYVIAGGCSDDSFSDFRSSLISRGKSAYENALTSPDSMTEEPFDEDEWYFEGYQYAILEAVESVVGDTPKRSRPHPEEPSGEAWEESAEVLKEIYPNLWSAFEHHWGAPNKNDTKQTKPWWKFW